MREHVSQHGGRSGSTQTTSELNIQQITDANSLCTHAHQTQGNNVDSHGPALLSATREDVRSIRQVT